MPSPSLRAVILGLAALASTTSASVSLSNFKPFVDNLTPECTTVYNTPISGCTADDFSTEPTQAICSPSCVQGLQQIQALVAKSCAQDDVNEVSIIGVFQNNLGIPALCPGAPIPTTASIASTAKATNTKAISMTFSPKSTSGTSASSTLSGGLIVDPTPLSSFSTAIVDEPTATADPSGGKKPKASHTGNSQLSNSNSGGGSPFDVQSTSLSPHLRVTDTNMAIVMATLVLFVACA